jgi:hypothetical protein
MSRPSFSSFRSTLVWLLLLLLLAPNKVAASDDCILECAHDAQCYRRAEHAQLKQSGRLTDGCRRCPTNYGGVACDIPLHACTANHDCAGANNKCDASKGICTDACAAIGSWLTSEFATYACRKSMTDYCHAKENPGGYCTNGGKCTSGLQGDKWDKSELCHCPKEFTGTHCERVNLPASVSLPTPRYDVSSGLSTGVIALLAVLASGLGIAACAAAFVYYFRRTYRQKRRHSGRLGMEGIMKGDNDALVILAPTRGEGGDATRRTSPRSSPTTDSPTQETNAGATEDAGATEEAEAPLGLL